MNRTGMLRRQSGFSLIELAVVLVIVGLLVGGGIAALTAATEQTRRSDAQRQLAHVRDALYGFAMSEGRLPCPDTDYPPDGWENWPNDRETNSAGSNCNADQGALPWIQLGLGRRDPWGSPLLYRVERGDVSDPSRPNFAHPTASSLAPAFELDHEADLTVRDGDAVNIVQNAPAVVVSSGPQGAQVWTDSAFNCIAAGSNDFSADENENCDADDTFVAAELRPPDVGNAGNPGGGRFDDVVIWIPLPILKARMVDAGVLP